MTNLSYRLYRLTTSLLHRCRRRFTGPGFAVFAGWTVTGIMGTNTEQSLAYQIFSGLTGLLIVAGLFAWTFRGRFTVTRQLPRFATAGQPVRYQMSVRNLRNRLERGLTVLEDLADPRPSATEFAARHRALERRHPSFRLMRRRPVRFQSAMGRITETPVPNLPPRGKVEVSIEMIPLRRGVLRFTGASVCRADPIGLFRSPRRVRAPQSLPVLPKRYPVPAAAMPGNLKFQEGGVAQASSVGESEEFVSLRDYRPGDPVRRIHWKSWARMNKPIVREYQDEFFVRHALVLDTFTDLDGSDQFEEAVSVAASFACSVLTQESLLDLMFVGPKAYTFTAGRGVAHVDQMLEVLASVRAASNPDFDLLSSSVMRHAPSVCGCILVLLEWNEPRRELVRKLKASGIPTVVFVIRDNATEAPSDPRGDDGPDLDRDRDADPDRIHELHVDRIAEDLASITLD